MKIGSNQIATIRRENLQLFHFTRDNNVWDRPQVLVGKDNAPHTWSSSIWMNRFSVACCLGIKSVLASQNHIRREFPKYVEEKGSSTLIALASHYPGCCEPSAGVTSCWTSLLHPCLLQQIIKVDIFYPVWLWVCTSTSSMPIALHLIMIKYISSP